MARRRTSDWLTRAGDWVQAAAIAVGVLLFVVLLPLWLAVAIAQWSFKTGIFALEAAVAAALMPLTAIALWWAFNEQRLSKILSESRSAAALRALMVGLFALASFASVTSFLYLEGAVEISEPAAQEDVIFEFMVVYVWHLLDTVPLLDIPQNLQWSLPFEFENSLGGLLLIVFTACVILPLIRVVRAIWVGHREPYEDTLRSALRKNLPDWKTEKLLGEIGYDRAIVEKTERILVDVMHDVTTEDAPLRRLEVVRRRLAAYYDATGYVLVVDAVAERARDRIDDAFQASDLPAALVVWRSDEPGRHVAEAVERLAERIPVARRAKQPGYDPD